MRRVPQQAAEDIQLQVMSLLRRARPPPSNITHDEDRAIHTLKNDPELVILPANKGSKTLVIDHDEYDRMLQGMLNDHQAYKKID